MSRENWSLGAFIFLDAVARPSVLQLLRFRLRPATDRLDQPSRVSAWHLSRSVQSSVPHPGTQGILEGGRAGHKECFRSVSLWQPYWIPETTIVALEINLNITPLPLLRSFWRTSSADLLGNTAICTRILLEGLPCPMSAGRLVWWGGGLLRSGGHPASCPRELGDKLIRCFNQCDRKYRKCGWPCLFCSVC